MSNHRACCCDECEVIEDCLTKFGDGFGSPGWVDCRPTTVTMSRVKIESYTKFFVNGVAVVDNRQTMELYDLVFAWDPFLARWINTATGTWRFWQRFDTRNIEHGNRGPFYGTACGSGCFDGTLCSRFEWESGTQNCTGGEVGLDYRDPCEFYSTCPMNIMDILLAKTADYSETYYCNNGTDIPPTPINIAATAYVIGQRGCLVDSTYDRRRVDRKGSVLLSNSWTLKPEGLCKGREIFPYRCGQCGESGVYPLDLVSANPQGCSIDHFVRTCSRCYALQGMCVNGIPGQGATFDPVWMCVCQDTEEFGGVLYNCLNGPTSGCDTGTYPNMQCFDSCVPSYQENQVELCLNMNVT